MNNNSTYRRLGNYIEQRREKNKGFDVPIRGVSKEGFIPPKQQDADVNMYNVFYKNDFVFNPARMELNSIALNEDLEQGICSSLYEIFYIKDTNVLNPLYLNLLIKTDHFTRFCEFVGWGSVREYCRFADISEYYIEVPPIEVQNKIVSHFNAIRAKIANNKQTIAKLEEAAQALYRKMFVDGIDVNNLPEGWRMGTLGEAIKLGGGGTPSTSNLEYWNSDDVAFYSPGDRTNEYFVLNTEKHISNLGLEKCSSKLYPLYTTFVTARGATTGRLVMAGKPMAINQTCYAILSKNDNPFYIHQLSIEVMAKLKNAAVGAVFEALTTKDFEIVEIIIPTKETINCFESKAIYIYERILLLQKENEKLTEMLSVVMA